MFPGPVRFRMPHAALVFDAAYLALASRCAATNALQAMLQRALPLTVLYRRDRLLAQLIAPGAARRHSGFGRSTRWRRR